MPEEVPFTVLGELFDTYIVAQQGEEAFLIDKHAAHERVLFDRLRAQKQEIVSQTLLAPQVCRLGQRGRRWCWKTSLCWMSWAMGWRNLGRERCCCARFPWTSPRSRGRIASPAGPGSSGGPAGGPGQSAGQSPAHHGLQGRYQGRLAYRSPGAGGPGRQVLGREDLKYCPHGRPVCIRLTKQQLERQFGRA